MAAIEADLGPLDESRRGLLARQRLVNRRRRAGEADRVGTALDATAEVLKRDWLAYHADREPHQAKRPLVRRLRSKIARVESLLEASRRLAEELIPGPDAPRIDHRALRLYFPYQLDYRGRVYAMPAPLNPQGDDVARALLEFADGKPLGVDGEFWLAVHLANTHGHGKAPFEERRAWVRAHDGPIRELAKLLDPTAGSAHARLAALPPGARGVWAAAKEPWLFLVACGEWARREVPGFVSHLPIALDASASGLQHLSALVRDRPGAAVTNLLDAEQPTDIYQQIADELTPIVVRDAALGDAHAAVWARTLDRTTGKMVRGVVKRGVMTTPYGVTRAGLRKQLQTYLQDELTGQSDDPWADASYLAGVLEGRIEAVVPAAHAVQRWLKEVAITLAERHRSGIAWVTPAGFPVVVAHARQKIDRFTWTEGGTRRERQLVLRVPDPDGGIDKERQERTVAPNFVHALDAAHLMLTVSRLRAEGLRHFAVIHDSYGVHACDVPRLRRALGEEFVRMYRAPLLEQFIDMQIADLSKPDAVTAPKGQRTAAPQQHDTASPEGTSTDASKEEKEPPTLQELRSALPPFGDLAIEEVLRARYMFA